MPQFTGKSRRSELKAGGLSRRTAKNHARWKKRTRLREILFNKVRVQNEENFDEEGEGYSAENSGGEYQVQVDKTSRGEDRRRAAVEGMLMLKVDSFQFEGGNTPTSSKFLSPVSPSVDVAHTEPYAGLRNDVRISE